MPDTEAVEEAVSVGKMGVPLAVCVSSGVELGVSLAVSVPLAVDVRVAARMPLGEPLPDPLPVPDFDTLGVSDGEAVGVVEAAGL